MPTMQIRGREGVAPAPDHLSALSFHLSPTPQEAAIRSNDLMLPTSEIMASEDAQKS